MTRYYRAFGQILSSELSLPELVPADRHDDAESVSIAIKKGHVSPLGRVTVDGILCQANEVETVFRIERVARYYVDDKGSITVDCDPEASEEAVRMYLLGPVLGTALYRQRHFVLHASAVCLNGHGVVFAGMSGAGKSALAAGLARVGHQWMADDLCCLEAGPSTVVPQIIPSFPRLLLWPDTLQSLGFDAHAYPKPRPDLEKRVVLARDTFSDQYAPLRTTCFLSRAKDEDDGAVRLTPLEGRSVLLSLLNHCFHSRYQKALPGAEVRLLGVCAQLLHKSRVYRLELPRTFYMEDLAETLLESVEA